jgi:hypothetical protein
MSPRRDPQQEIRQMRADVDRLAAKPSPEPGQMFHVVRPDSTMKIRLRELHPGERVKAGDLRMADGQLVLVSVSWWRRYVIKGWSEPHFRVVT